MQTEHGSMAHVDLDKNVKEKVSLSVFDKGGNKTYSGKAKIGGRGNGTWNQVKNPYNLTFSEKVSLLGFEGVTKLCLLANFKDESGLKNPLAYYVAKEKGIKYTSDYRAINLFVDGDYKGLYGVVTKQEYEKHIEEDGLQAVFEFALAEEAKNAFVTKNGTCVRLYYGDKTNVLQKIDSFEEALYSRDYATVFEKIDIDSFVNKICMEEFLANCDMTYKNSQYFCIDSTGKIYCINPWDYEWILGYNTEIYCKVDHEIAIYLDKSNVFWYRYLIENDIFCNKVIEVLKNDYDKNFFYKIKKYLNDYILKVKGSWQCDEFRYCHHRNTFVKFEFDLIEQYYDMYISTLCNRSDFLVSFFSSPEKYCVVDFRLYPSFKYSNLCVPAGERLSNYIDDKTQLQRQNGELLIWKTQDGKSIDDIKEVTENLVFYGKERNIYQNTLFMKLRNNAFFLVPIGSVCFLLLLLVFRELHFYYN